MTPEVRIAKPEYVERIISSMQNIEKGLSYVFVRPWLGNGLLTSKGESCFFPANAQILLYKYVYHL